MKYLPLLLIIWLLLSFSSPELSCKRIFEKAGGEESLLLSDLRLAISALEVLPPAITFLGGSRVSEKDRCYALALEIGELMATNGIPVCTGGGPGIMEYIPRGYLKGRGAGEKTASRDLLPAVTRGFPPGAARKDCRTQGFTVWLPDERRRNPSIEVGAEFRDMSIRKIALTENKRGFCFFPGGFGTEDEFFEIWDRGIMLSSPDPIVLAGPDYWKPQVEALEKVAVRDRSLISTGEIAKLKRHIIADARQFLEIIGEEKNPCGFEQDPGALLESLEKDINRAAETYDASCDAVTFIGSPHLSPDDRTCAMAKAIACRLAEKGVPLRVGSGGTVAESILAGIRESGKDWQVQGFLTRNDRIPRGAKNLRLSALMASNVIHKRFMSRKLIALVVLPGDTRALSEFFGILCLMQTGSLARKPIILLGSDYWGPLLKAYQSTMLTDERKLIAPDDLKLVTITDDADAVEALLEKSGDEEKNDRRSEKCSP
jgi:uncharacterized protein (TIGR00730 family)